MLEYSVLDVAVDSAESSSDILNAVLPLCVVKNSMEEFSWLLVVGVRVLMRVSSNNGV